jgi:serine/threonine protein kinase
MSMDDLGTRYRIQGRLGSGTFGAVYLCYDQELEREVAVKVLRHLSSDEASRERFRREAEAAARLRHPNVLQVYGLGETPAGDPFLVSEYLAGGSLDALLLETPSLDPTRARRWLAQLASGLSAAHAAGVVHRDVKPANVMRRGEDVLLGDFGLALLESVPGHTLEDLTRTGQAIGTPRYMAPEVLSGRRATPASDVWSLGAVGYRMLYGQSWRSDDLSSIIEEARRLPEATEERFGRFPGIDEALRGALHGDPRRRLPSATAFLAALEGEVPRSHTEETVSPPATPGLEVPGPLPGTEPRAPASRLLLAVPGVVLLSLSAALFVATTRRTPPPPVPSAAPPPTRPPAPLEEPPSLRQARHTLRISGPDEGWDVRRRYFNDLCLVFAGEFLEPNVPRNLRRLIHEAEAAAASGAPVAQAALGLARVAARLNVSEQYLTDALMTRALEGRGPMNFDRVAWEDRVQEIRIEAQDALTRARSVERSEVGTLYLALRSLAGAPDIARHVRQAAEASVGASPEETYLLVAVASRVLRRRYASDTAQAELREAVSALGSVMREPSQALTPARARALRDLLEAASWLLSVERMEPKEGSMALFEQLADSCWEARRGAPREIAAAYRTALRWATMASETFGIDPRYEGLLERLNERFEEIGADLPDPPLTPGW